ncbi:hypothetical protein MKW94_028376 [Papaver nudicaule]|uniref:Replication protein A C-terminal domain-containing protein n=1 Tax=Papaver nudicaule TaxID=74823 RepID=A0AA41S838_PAPNU|nr:hypothetical protein [Papaver nudicaule]
MSQFDANANFGGGGYMPSSQATQTTEQGSSTAKGRDSKGLLPLTVKQISQACIKNEDKANFVVDGVEVHTVNLVGLVFNMAARVTEYNWILDDGTGRIECQRWINDNIDTLEMAEIKDGMYVEIHGNLKSFQGKRILVAFSVRPVTDFNQVAYHFIECIYVHCHNTKSQGQGSNSAQPQTTNAAIASGPSSYQTAPSYQISGHPIANGIPAGIPGRVLEMLSTHSARDQGLHVQEIAKHLKLPVQKIREAAKHLEDEGMAYNTIDDDHYRSSTH